MLHSLAITLGHQPEEVSKNFPLSGLDILMFTLTDVPRNTKELVKSTYTMLRGVDDPPRHLTVKYLNQRDDGHVPPFHSVRFDRVGIHPMTYAVHEIVFLLKAKGLLGASGRQSRRFRIVV
jgi:hypothetical protein